MIVVLKSRLKVEYAGIKLVWPVACESITKRAMNGERAKAAKRFRKLSFILTFGL
jgi:hypothetical protein